MGRGRERLGNDFPIGYFTPFRINYLETELGKTAQLNPGLAMEIAGGGTVSEQPPTTRKRLSRRGHRGRLTRDHDHLRF